MIRHRFRSLHAWRAPAAWTRTAVVCGCLVGAACGGSRPAGEDHASESTGPDADTGDAADADVINVDPDAQRQIQLRTERAVMRSLSATIRTTGVIGPDETRVAHVRPLARGVVDRVLVRRGDRVREGQALASYDNIELGDLIGEYRAVAASVEKASAEAEVTKRALERGEQLVELGSIARADYERRQAEDASARAALSSERARLASLRQRLRRFGVGDDADPARVAASETLDPHTTLRAPFAGVVTVADVAAGEVVDPEQELLTVTNLSTVWVQGDVYERDLAGVDEGSPARVRVQAYPTEVFEGKVTYVSDVLEPSTRTARVRCEVDNADGRLKLEMSAIVEIPTKATRSTLAVPAAAIQRIDDAPAVFVRLDDHRFQRRQVRAGREVDGWVEVLEGLQPGEIVATQGAVMLRSKLQIGELGEEHE